MISHQNPELADLIINNQAEFLRIMSEGEREGPMSGIGGTDKRTEQIILFMLSSMSLLKIVSSIDYVR